MVTSGISADDARARAAQVARACYGRLIGILSARSGDIAAAEDALSDALHRALTHWPAKGIPDNPEAWLVRVARNRMTDAHRRAIRDHPLPVEAHEIASDMPNPINAVPDDPRLGLMFVCAHPAIAESARTPLMLQTVLGFTAEDIARAYVSSPAALSKLLSRAKARIKANAIPFEIPEGPALAERLSEVSEAIYGCYALVWTEAADARDMQREALYLADLLATQMPDIPEALGLSALLGFLHSRREARSRDGAYVPLDRQDTALWDHDLIAAARARLWQAFDLGQPGRFQIEAAIQSVHAARARSGQTNWAALYDLYQALIAMAPTLGAMVSQCAVIAQLRGPEAGLAMLNRLDDARVARFQPYWATRASLLEQAGRPSDAAAAYDRAISLTHNGQQRAFLDTGRRRVAPGPD